MRCSEFCYGKPSKTLKNAVSWLNKNKRRLQKNEWEFDFPDYWGMPKRISYRLSGDEVDWIQSEVWEWVENNIDLR